MQQSISNYQLPPPPVALGASPSSRSPEQALDAFLRSLEGKNRSSATIRAYRTDLTRFFAWLHESNVVATTVDRVVRADITEYLASLGHQGLSGVSRARRLAAIREYFRFLEANDVIAKSP